MVKECRLDPCQHNKITFRSHDCQSRRVLLMDDKAGLGGRLDLPTQRKGEASLVWHQEGCTLDLIALTVEIRVKDELQTLPPFLVSSTLSSTTSDQSRLYSIKATSLRKS